MKWLGLYSEEYERLILRAMAAGGGENRVKLCSVAEWKNDGVRPRTDGAIIISMTANRQPVWRHYRDQGKPVVYLDKGYVRLAGEFKTMYWRVAVNDLQPVAYLDRLQPQTARWGGMGQVLLPRHDGDAVCVAGSTNRYHSWYGLPPSREWAHQTIEEVRRHWSGKILWRPKPSLIKRGLAFTVPGTIFDDVKHGLPATLRRCRLLVTHGSAVGCNAVWGGVPACTLGPGVAWSVSSHSVAHALQTLPFPTDEERLAWCGRLAAVQYTIGEMERGAIWDHLRTVFGLLAP